MEVIVQQERLTAKIVSLCLVWRDKIYRVDGLAIGLLTVARRVDALWISLLAPMLGNFTVQLEIVVMMHFNRCVEAVALWRQVLGS